MEELQLLAKNGAIREDVLNELMRINSRENSAASPASVSSKKSHASATRPSLAMMARPLSHIIRQATEVEEEGEILIQEGWLFLRKNGAKEGWKRKYVTLSYTRIEWSNAQGSKKGKEGFDLSRDQMVNRLEDDVLAFEITPQPDPRSAAIHFSADSEADIRKWLGEIQRVINLQKGASERDLPILLNRPSRSRSQIARDYVARETAFKNATLQTATEEADNPSSREAESTSSTRSSNENEPSPPALNGESSSVGSIQDKEEEEEPDKEELDLMQLIEVARTKKDTVVAELNQAHANESLLSTRETDAAAELQNARTLESSAFEDTTRTRKEEKLATERLSKLVADEIKASKDVDNFKTSAAVNMSHLTPSKALQKLLIKDGVQVKSDPDSDKLNELLFVVSNARKFVQIEKEKLKQREEERVKAEADLRNARNKVAESIKLIQELTRQKRALNTRLQELEHEVDNSKNALEKLEQSLIEIRSRPNMQ